MFKDILKELESLKKFGKHIDEILTHSHAVIPGWMFIIQKGERLYLVMNTQDLLEELDGLPLAKAIDIQPAIFDVPMRNEDLKRLDDAMKGVFIWSRKVVHPKRPARTAQTGQISQNPGSNSNAVEKNDPQDGKTENGA